MQFARHTTLHRVAGNRSSCERRGPLNLVKGSCCSRARNTQTQMARRIAHRYRCGITVRVPEGCLTRTEACEILKVGYWRFRGLSTRPRFIRHPMPRGPHCHRVAYVPIPLAKYLKRKLSYDYDGAIPIGAIDEAEQENTIEGVLFAKWAIERNARCAARLLREVGLRSQARALRYQPTSARAAA
jgi:hypothetical protein